MKAKRIILIVGVVAVVAGLVTLNSCRRHARRAVVNEIKREVKETAVDIANDAADKTMDKVLDKTLGPAPKADETKPEKPPGDNP